MTQRWTWVGGAWLATMLAPAAMLAHPLGNDSITHFGVLYIFPNRIELDFLLDIAEVPASQARETEIDANKDGEDGEDEQRAWLERKAAEFLPYLTLTLDGKGMDLRVMEPETSPPAGTPTTRKAAPTRVVLKIPGVGGMPTYRLLIRYVAAMPILPAGQTRTLTYKDALYPQTRGLKRVILERPGKTAAVIHETTCQFWDEGPDPFLYDLYDPSNMPEERTATIVFSAAATTTVTATAPVLAKTSASAPATQTRPVIVNASPPETQPWHRFTDPRNDPSQQEKYARMASRIVERFRAGVSAWGLIAIMLTCFGYGAYHALMPGHAKTIVAAYLISMHGTYLHAVLLAIIVTCTHTALVIVVGLVFLQFPARGAMLQLWLGLTAGAIIAGMGGWLAYRALTGRLLPHEHSHSHDHGHSHGIRGRLRALFTHSHAPAHEHAHPHEHAHDEAHAHPRDDHGHGHPHDHHHHHREPKEMRITIPLLLWLGVSGGIVPCPTAVLIMLAFIAMGRADLGLYAVCVFSLGLAVALMGVGFLALSSRQFANRLMGEEGSKRWLQTILPALGGTAVLILGLIILAHYTALLAFNTPLVSWLG